LVVNTSASDCLERLVPEMIYYVSRGTLNSTHSLSLRLEFCLLFTVYDNRACFELNLFLQ